MQSLLKPELTQPAQQAPATMAILVGHNISNLRLMGILATETQPSMANTHPQSLPPINPVNLLATCLN
jgi:hypothetical protein